MATSSTPRPLALSPSRASDYKQCPLLYRFRAIDKLPEPKTIAQVKGTLVHAVLEEMHKLPRDERTYPAAVKMIKPSWAEMTAKDEELLELVPEEDTYDFFVAARELLKGYFQMENPQGFDCQETEMYVNTVLPNGVPVRGFIDRAWTAPQLARSESWTIKPARSHFPAIPRMHNSRCAFMRWSTGAF